MGDTHVGLQARLMSQALRKLTANLNRSNTICHLHQPAAGEDRCHVRLLLLRHPGHAGRRHAGEDRQDRQPAHAGRGALVRPRARRGRAQARSSTGSTTASPSGSCSSRWRSPAGTGARSSRCTANHQIRTPGGWREAQELVVGDRVLQSVPHHLSELPVGGRARRPHGRRRALADPFRSRSPLPVGATAPSRRSTATGRRRCSPTSASADRPTPRARSSTTCQPLPELAELREAVYVDGKKVFSHDYLKQLTPLSLAVWYMDDGGFTLRAKGPPGAHPRRQRPFGDLRRGDGADDP